MIFILERVSDPDLEPVTLAEMKRHLRVDSSDFDDDISGLIKTGREWVEDYTGRALIDQGWRLTIDRTRSLVGDTVGGFVSNAAFGYYCGVCVPTPLNELLLRKSPVLAISSFVTVDAAGDETAVDAATYQLREADGKWPRIVPLSGALWTASTLRIAYRAGYADRVSSPQQDASVVPDRYKQAIKLYGEALFDRDKDLMPLLMKTAENCVRAECVDLGMA